MWQQKKPWEQDWSVPQSAPQPITIGTPDPYKAREDRRADQRIGIDQANFNLRQQEANKPPPGYRFKPDGTMEAIPGGPAEKKGEKTDEQRKAETRAADMLTLAQQIDEMQRLYEGNLAGQGIVKSLSEYIPNNEKDRLNTLGAGVGQLGMSAFRVPGSGEQSDRELTNFIAANQPNSWDRDAQLTGKLDNLRLRIDNQRDAMGLGPYDWYRGTATPGRQRQQDTPIPGQMPQQSPGMDRTQGMIGGGNAGTQAGIAQQGQRFSTDADERFAALAQAAFDRGAGRAELNSLAKRYGYAPYGADLNQALQFRARGGKGAKISAPQSGTRDLSTVNQISASPVGEYFRSTANGLTAGLSDEITGGIESLATGRPFDEAVAEADLRKQIGAEAFPKANLTGNLTGGIAATLGGGALMRGLGVAQKFGRFAPVAGDLAYGAAYGAGENNQNRLAGAGAGAALGAAGGVAGRNLIGGAGRVASGAQGAAQQFLRDRGVSQTVGQTLGGAWKTAEDKIMSWPVVGSMVAKRRGEGDTAFNQAAFREVFPNATNVGAQGLEEVGQAVNQAYSQALQGVAVPIDQTFKREMGAAIKAAQRVPGHKDDVGYLLQKYVEPELANGTLTGDGLQAILRGLSMEKAAVKLSPRGFDYGEAIDLIGDAATALAERGSPGTAAALREANRLYGAKRVLENAVLAADKNGGIFTPQQLSRAAINNTKRYGGVTKAAQGQRPFYELTKAGQEVLPSSVSNSGSADRLLAAAVPMLPAAAGGGAAAMDWIDPQTAVMIGTLGLPFTKAGQRAAVAALTKRPPGMAAGGEVLKRQRRLGGLFGAPLLGQNSN